MVTKEEVQAARMIREDFPTFCRTLIKVKNKDGEVVPFELNKSQKQLWKTIKKMDSEGRPVRIIILKARQLGMSTMVQAYLLWKAITKPGHGGLVVAHQEDAAAELFGKVEMAYRLLPEDIHGAMEGIRDSQRKGKKLAFGGELNTSLYVDTAGNKSLGRSQTFQHVHLSELAFYDSPDEIMFGLAQSVPNKPGTTVIIESTANGMGNYFHNRWTNATEGKSAYEPIFLPWYLDDENADDYPEDFKLDKEERKLKKLYKLTKRQLWWRRRCIEDDCDGDVDKFRQENPISPEEAFIITGNTYFTPAILEKYQANTKEPIREGSFDIIDGKPVFNDWKGGPWRVWKKPEKGRSYIVSGDPAGGTARDYSAAHVIDATSLEQVASYRYKLDPDEFARELKWMGLAYNKALVACEKNGEGRATVLKLYKDLKYPRIFYHTTQENWNGGVANTYGWVTSTRTRPTMLAQLGELVRSSALRIYDSRTVDEMKTFVRVEGAPVARAASGAWDDMVMALAIACNSEVRAQAGSAVEYDAGNYEPAISNITGY